MLHADAAELLIGPLGYNARDQIRSGRELLQIATNIAPTTHATNSELKALASFGGRWYAMTARLLLAHGHFTVAGQIAVEGRIRYPESPDLFVVLGLLSEWRAGLGLDAGDLRGYVVRGEPYERGFGTTGPYRGNASQDLETAAGNYRRAIAIDPLHAGARLRLAWVHLLTSDRRVWEDVSTAFIQSASTEAQFLAHLLRGTAAEHERNAPLALAEYQAARLLMPDSQTACLAVSSAQALNGQLGEARGSAVECLKPAAAPSVDSWTLFRFGPDGCHHRRCLARRGAASVTLRSAGAAILCAGLVTTTLASAEQAFRSKIEGVEVDVAVTRGGKTVAGLTGDNFVVTDNGVIQEVTATLLAAEPLRLTLVLDVSKSVSGSRLTSLIKASRATVHALRPEDQVSLITFSHRVTSVVPMGHNRSAINDALTLLSGDGATALRDATYLGLATASDDHSRALLLLFSDGFDTASFLTEDTVLESAKRSNAVVHAVQFRPDAFLRRLAEITGGRNWSAQSDRQLEELFGRVLDEMRARYLLTYSPSAPQQLGWHQIKVSLKGTRGDVIAKQGYFVQ